VGENRGVRCAVAPWPRGLAMSCGCQSVISTGRVASLKNSMLAASLEVRGCATMRLLVWGESEVRCRGERRCGSRKGNPGADHLTADMRSSNFFLSAASSCRVEVTRESLYGYASRAGGCQLPCDLCKFELRLRLQAHRSRIEVALRCTVIW
jgi:hypothetical protein